MYDDHSNSLRPVEIDRALLDQVNALEARLPPEAKRPPWGKGGFQKHLREELAAAGERAGIPRESQGPVFMVGEILEIKGRRFEVRGFEGGLLHLEGKGKV